jgi:O-antigen/teichoic acid export membrane protein
MVVMLSEQVLVTAGPLIVRGTEGAATAGFVFNVVMVARAPIAVFQGVAASLLPHLTRLRSSQADPRAFNSAVRATLLGVAAFTGLVAATLLIAGPQLMQAAFGASFEYGRSDLEIVAGGMGLFLGAATLNQAALARGQARPVAAAWALAALVFVGFNALPILDAVLRVEIGFAGAAGALCLALLALYRRTGPEAALEPGSPEELQARLGAAEEGA